jgi:nucleoside-diphosphate-sugar epimerase
MVLLIGATSFLGPYVLKALLSKNHKVNCLVRPSSSRTALSSIAKSAGKNIDFSTGNLESGDSIITLVKKAGSVIYIVDLKYTHLLETFLKTAARTGLKRVIFISSTTVLIPFESRIKSQKINSENLIKKSGFDYTILRPSMIYGSKNDPNFSKMIKFIKDKGFFITFGSGNNLIHPIYIEDVAEAVSSIINNKKTYKKIYNIAGKSPLKYNDMLKIVKEKLKKNFRVIKLPLRISSLFISLYSRASKKPLLTGDQIARMGVDKAYSYRKAREDFGFSPISFEKGIEELIKKLDAQN